MNPITTQQLLSALAWRYATKVFDPNKKIPADLWQALEHALALSPSSYGLQPYRFLVIHDAAKRAELLPHSWNQKQVVDCSHYVVFTGRTQMTEADLDRFLALTSRVRNIPAETLSAYRGMMMGDLVNGTRGKIAHEWATRQAYIALGNLMTCAAVLGVDACPWKALCPRNTIVCSVWETVAMLRSSAAPWVTGRPTTNMPVSPRSDIRRRT